MSEYPKETRDPIADVWVSFDQHAGPATLADVFDNPLQGERTPFHGEGQWPVRIDEHVEGPVDHWVQSACVMCKSTARTVRLVQLQPGV